MPKRSDPRDVHSIETADELDEIVSDKREGWRATAAKARRRQRRYKNRFTQELLKQAQSGGSTIDYDDFDDKD